MRRSSESMTLKVAVTLLVALSLVSAIVIVIPVTTAKNKSSEEPKFRKSDNPLLHLPVDEEKWLPILPPEPVGRPIYEDAEQDIDILIYDIKTKKTKKILKTKPEKTTFKLPGSLGSLPSELILESPIGYGDRVRVTPTTDYPWRTIVKLRMWFPSGQYMATGFIIDDYHILTAGHCVYDPFGDGWALDIEVIPALDGGFMPFYHAWATAMTISSYWYDYGWYEEDFAIITLDRNIGDFTGWMGLYTALPSDPIYTSILNTAGYPGDLDGGENMYYDSDWGDWADEYNHGYWMDTRPGQSGSPVWSYDGTYHDVLSIVAYETDSAYPNMGTRLSEYWFGLINYVRGGDTPPTDYANLIDDGQDWSDFSPTQVVPGLTPFSVWSDTVNIGTAESGIFQVSYYASTDTEITSSDHLIGTVSIPSISPFYYRDSDWLGTFPSDIPDGTYWVGWIIDSTDAVPEPLDDGEGNNVAYKDSYQLTVESTALITYYTNPNYVGSITFNYDDYTDSQSGSYTPNDYLITANAPTGYAFHHWEYDHIGEPGVGVYVPNIMANPVTATVSGAGWLKAAFSALITFRTEPSGIGSITYGGTDYTDGQSLWEVGLPPDNSNTMPITANPQTGYEFTRWECIGLLSVDNQMANPATLTVDGTGVLYALFSAIEDLVITDITDIDGASITGGVYGDVVKVFGSGATAGESVQVGWDSLNAWDGETGILSSTIANGDGTFEVWFNVPEAFGGLHYIWVKDTSSEVSAMALFSVHPTITLDFENGPVGKVVTVLGNGFTAGGFVDTITLNGAFCTKMGTIAIDAVGKFMGAFVIPGVENLGAYDITVTDSSVSAANNYFLITGLAEIELTPEMGVQGSTVSIVGWNFAQISGAEIEIWICDYETKAELYELSDNLDTESNGEFTGTFTVPALSSDLFKIKAKQVDYNIEALAAFRIGLSIEDIYGNPISGGVKGDTVVVKGAGVTAGATANLYWDSVMNWDGEKGQLNATEAKATGEFEVWFNVPRAINDLHYLWFKDTSNGRTDGPFPFTVNAVLILNPSSGLPGDEITINGYGFDGSVSVIDITFDASSLSTTPSTPITDVTGSWTATFNVLIKPYNDYDVIATDAQGKSAMATFAIGPVISLDVAVGPVGTVVEVHGRGFTDDGTVTSVSLNGIDCGVLDDNDLEIDGNGEFWLYLVIPGVNMANRDYEIIVSDDGGKAASIYFTVTGLADIELDPCFGPQGTIVSISGVNFTPSSDVVISVEGSSVKTLQTDSGGDFYGTFTFPAVSTGTHQVVAEQEDYNIDASQSFLVRLIMVVLSRSEGPMGTEVTLTGTGFTELGGWNATFGEVVIFYDETVDANGVIYGIFNVPMVDAGTYTITVLDIDTEIELCIDFLVTDIILSATDYLLFTPGHSNTFTVSDDGLTNCPVELVFQNSIEDNYFITLTNVTLTKIGEGSYWRDSAIYVGERDGLLTAWGGAPVGNQAHFFWLLHTIPATFTDGDTWEYQYSDTSYGASYVGEHTVNGVSYSDCILLQFDSTNHPRGLHFQGIGEAYLAKDVGIIQFTFYKTDGNDFTATLTEHSDYAPRSISGTFILEGGSLAEGYSVGLSNFVNVGYDATLVDVDGVYSLPFYGSSVILRYGPISMDGESLMYEHSQEDKINGAVGDIVNYDLTAPDVGLAGPLEERPPELIIWPQNVTIPDDRILFNGRAISVNEIESVYVNGELASGLFSGIYYFWQKEIPLTESMNDITITAYDNGTLQKSTSKTLWINYEKDAYYGPRVEPVPLEVLPENRQVLTFIVNPNGTSTRAYLNWAPSDREHSPFQHGRSLGYGYDGYDDVTITYDIADKDDALTVGEEIEYRVHVESSGYWASHDVITITVGNPDYSQPWVESVDPQPEQQYVSPDSVIDVYFNEQLNHLTLTPDNILLNNVPFVGEIEYDFHSHKMTLVPTSPFQPNTQISIELTSGITDYAGNALIPYSWVFYTNEIIDLILEGDEVLLIENCVYNHSGNIFVRDTASLILRNATLALYWPSFHKYDISFQGSSYFESFNSTITDIPSSFDGGGYYLFMMDSSFANITSSRFHYPATLLDARGLDVTVKIRDSHLDYINICSDSKVEINNSQANVHIYSGSPNVTIWDSENIGQILIHFSGSTYAELSLMPGYHSYWSLQENETVIDCDIEVKLINSTMSRWSLRAYNQADINIKDSILSYVESRVEASFNLENVIIRDAGAEDNSSITLRDSTIRNLETYDSSKARMVNTSIDTYGQVNAFNESEIYIGWYLDATAINEAGPIEGAIVEVYTMPEPSLIDSKLTNEEGLARFDLWEKILRASGAEFVNNYNVFCEYQEVRLSEEILLTDNYELIFDFAGMHQYSVSGMVFFSSTPLDNILVELTKDGEETPTSSTTTVEGFYSFSDVVPGLYWLTAYGPTPEYVPSVGYRVEVIDQDVTKNIDLPKPLTLLSPEDDSYVTPYRPTFSWEVFPNAVRYSISVHEVSDWTWSVWEDTQLTTYTLQTDLSDGKEYGWSIYAYDADNHLIGFALPWWSFTIGTTACVSIGSSVVAPGYFTEVPVSMSHVTKIAGLGFDLYWKPDVVSINGIRLSDDLSTINNSLTFSIDAVLGKATVGLVNIDNPDYLTWQEERPVLIVEIEAIGLHGTFSILDLEAVNVTYAEPWIPRPVSNVEDGMVIIQILGIIHGYVTYSHSGIPMEAATVELSMDGSTINMIVTGVDGEYEFLDLQLGEYTLTVNHERIQVDSQYTTFWTASANVILGETTEVDFSLKIRGDLNDNGAVDIGDVAKTANMYVGNIQEEVEITDFNGNSSLDIGDVAKLANYYVENIDEV